MTSARAIRRFAFAYGTAFAIIYAIARAQDLALFTVYPSLDIVLLGMHRSRDVADPALGFLAPEAWWYGWTAMAAIGALLVGLVAMLLPDRSTRWFWSGWLWVIPCCAMIVCSYLAIPWFRL